MNGLVACRSGKRRYNPIIDNRAPLKGTTEMTKIFARAAIACAIAATAATALIPAAASAQDYRYGSAYDARGGYNYDPCARDLSKRSTTGGLIGLAAGAAIGSNVAGRHNRDEGAVLGGLLGAMVGSQAGKSSAACAPEPRHYAYAEPVYAPPPPPPPPPAPRSYYDRNNSYDDGCQMVESRIRLPDGRTQTRLVRTCMDSQGRYQIVD